MCGFVTVEKINEKKTSADFIDRESLAIRHRGPDNTTALQVNESYFVFHRLSIMDLSSQGNQPFCSNENHPLVVVCNGEIYNFEDLKQEILNANLKSNYSFVSESDCEILIPLLLNYEIKEVCQKLDGEFAFCGYDKNNKTMFAARDPMGIRPLFYGYNNDKNIVFSSEVKAIKNICINETIRPFPPGYYFYDGKFEAFHLHYDDSFLKLLPATMQEKDALLGINKLLKEAVIKRLHSDAPLGFLLSGGLDSSLVCAIAAKYLDKPITTFAIGIEDGPIDTKYAREVADFIQSDHHEILFKKEELFEALDKVIFQLETFDITTIRASLPMYLICKEIHKKTSLKVLLTGEVSDELFGYKYTDFAPNPTEFQNEAKKRVKELYLYDVLRADRSLSAHSLEARVPFSDKAFVDFVMNIDPSIKMNTTGVGKYLLRKAFEDEDLLPQHILFRDKAAFSDAVGHSMVDYLKQYAESKYSDNDFLAFKEKYSHATPISKESLLYREIFEKHYSGLAKSLIPDFWMPNQSWENCNVNDPSARELPNYGKSGE